MPSLGRDRLMEARVANESGARGVGREGRSVIEAALRLSTAHRSASGIGPRHPDFLHGGRTVLVLLMDTEVRDPSVLAAAALLDSEWPELSPAQASVLPLGERVVAALENMRVPRDADFVEHAVAMDPARLGAVLAERLDHLRHAHLWPDAERALRAVEEAERTYARLAEWLGGTLARRYARWLGAGRTARLRELGGSRSS